MATEVIVNEHYWRCNKYPWGCDIKHGSQVEAEACEKRKNNTYVMHNSDNFRSYNKKG